MKTTRRFIIGASTPSNPNKLVTTIKFSSAPTSAVASVPNLKYNKKNWFSFELDDASNSTSTALGILNAKTFTDGCGNNINYRMGVAMNGANPFNGVEYKYDGSNTSQTTKSVLSDLLNAGGDLSDHSYWHEPEAYGSGVTALQNTILMQDFIRRMFNGYETRTKVVPTNYGGHAQAAYDQGYLYSTSEGTFDSFTPVGLYTPEGDFNLVPTFGALRRGFSDSWDTDLAGLKAKIDLLLTKTNWFYRLGSHTLNNVPSFQAFFDYIKAQSNDQLWVATTREVFEYREMKNLPITQNLVGDTLTIEVDLTNLSAKNRWRDISFIINTTANIQSVTTNATSFSYNNTTKLVNIFKQSYNLSQDSINVESYFDNVYDVSKSLKSDGTPITDGGYIQTIPDRGTDGTKPMTYQGAGSRGLLAPIKYRSQYGGYQQFYNQTNTYFASAPYASDQSFPRELFLVCIQTKFNTYEAMMNLFGSYYWADNGDNEVRFRDNNDVAQPVGYPNRISAGLPIRQNYLTHIKFTQDSIGIKVELRINKVLVGTAYTFSDGRLNRPSLSMGAVTNSGNFGMNWQGHKIGSFTDSERTVIENALYSKYNIGQRIQAPLAESLYATKSGTVYTAGYTYVNPLGLSEDTAKRSVRWVLTKDNSWPQEQRGIQSGIYHTAVDGKTTWDSNTYPIPTGYLVSNVEVIVGDTSPTGNICNIPEKSYLS